jgi:hypothetical protein
MKLWSFIWPVGGAPWVSARVAAPTRQAAEALLPLDAQPYAPRVIVQYMGELGWCDEGVVSFVERNQ